MSATSRYEATQAATTDQIVPIAWTGPGLLRGAWYRIRFTIQEMNYATRRLTELRAPGLVDEQRRGR